MTKFDTCGTTAGYHVHRKADEPVCHDCKKARVHYEKRRIWDAHNGSRRLIDGTGTLRRIQGLVALGWTYTQLGERLGITAGGVYRMITRGGQIRHDVAAKVADLYDELSMTLPPETTKLERRNARYARTVAQKYEWVTPLRWDDRDIDDPAATPHGGYVSASRGDLIYDLDDLQAGISETCRRLGISREALQKWCENHAMNDVYSRMVHREFRGFTGNQHREAS